MKKRHTVKAYDADLAYVHDVGFGGFAESAATGILRLLEQASINDGRVVDLGCGSGIWAEKLIASGFDVTGVDFSPAMIAMARKRVPQGEFHTESFRTFRLPPCRVVTSLGEPFNYLFDEKHSTAQLFQLFRRIHRALEPGGLLIFDVAEHGRDLGRDLSWWQGDDWYCLTRFETDHTRQRLTRHVVTFRKQGDSYRRSEELHRMQLYRGVELATRLREIGFRVRLMRRYGEYRLPKKLVAIVARKA